MVYVGLNPRDVTAFEEIRTLTNSPKRQIFTDEVKSLMAGHYHSCCRISHRPVLDIVKRRTGIDVRVENVTYRHFLYKGDKVIIILVKHIRSATKEMYTREEIRKARVSFLLYTMT